MKLKTLTLKNFRSYLEPIVIEFDNLTAFVGKNDIGKSSILEALDIFFNDGKGIIKIDKDDVNKQAAIQSDTETIISASFEDLPSSIILDSTNETTLHAEYLLNNSGELEIVKKYSNAGTPKIYIHAIHPANPKCNNLFSKKDTDLRKIIESEGIDCYDKTKNAIMRSSIWNHYSTYLQLQETDIDISKGEAKSIWDKLQSYLPLYTLFQSDRKNNDSDTEVQDPLKEAVKQILADSDIQSKLSEVAAVVEDKLTDVSNRTLEKLKEMNPEVATSLTPIIPKSSTLKWNEVFKNVSIASDEDIPINKRGSGVKRLILLNFFRAEAERRMNELNCSSIIYAIEEPETSQHTEQQRVLIQALLSLASIPNTQIIITTHSANIVKCLNFNNLRLISNTPTEKKVTAVLPGQLPYPSLNEVNFLAFSEISEEYHNELYGYIEGEGELASFKSGKPTIPYIKQLHNGGSRQEQIILTEYIRHQIHHPENTDNPRFTPDQLKESICLMRDYIQQLH